MADAGTVGSLVDTLDDAGNLMSTTRHCGDVHSKGFWHRYVHVWVLDLSRGAVMMQHRAPTKVPFGSMWSCCTGHIGEAESSGAAASRALLEELKMTYLETQLEFMFSCKENASDQDLTLKQMLDVYALGLESSPSTYAIGIDADQATAVKYISIEELEEVYAEKLSDHVLVSNPEYPHRLFRSLRKLVREYHASIPRDDSDDETTNWKARQLLDTLDGSGLVKEPNQRGSVHRESVWHRAVHVWILDLTQNAVLLLQRAARKQHFAACWHCCSGYVQMGGSALPAVVKVVKVQLRTMMVIPAPQIVIVPRVFAMHKCVLLLIVVAQHQLVSTVTQQLIVY